MATLKLTVGAMFAGKSTALLRAVRSAMLIGKKPLVVNHILDTRMGNDAVRSHTGDSLECVQLSSLMNLLPQCTTHEIKYVVEAKTDVVGLAVVYMSNVALGGSCSITVSSCQGNRMWLFEGKTPSDVVDAAARVVDLSSDGLLRLLVSNIVLRTVDSCNAVDSDADKLYDCVFIDEGQFFPDLADFARNCTINKNCDVHVFGLDGDYRGQRFGQILDLVPWCDNVEKLVSVCGLCQKRPGLLSKRLVANEGQVLVGQCEYVQVCRECFMKA